MFALIALVMAFAAPATDEALFALYLGPDQLDGVDREALLVRIDGQEIPVPLPGADAAPEKPIFERFIAAGDHSVDVELRLAGRSKVFDYVDGYRLTLRGHLVIQARAGEVVAFKGNVVRDSRPFVAWEDRHHLVLAATSYRSARVAVAGETAVAPTVPAPPPAAASVTCSLEPVTFGFDQATLTPEVSLALDQFAACVGTTGGAIRLEGHCDVRGNAAYNQRLGQRRADAVAAYLRGRMAAAIRLSTRSWGKSQPRCEEASEACHARNRRVEAIRED
jgi:outer membrane protein OmpA-like peptidoglycan-associated protein